MIIIISIFCAAAIISITLLLLYWYALPKFIVNKIRSSPNPDGQLTYPQNYEQLKQNSTVTKNLIYPSQYPTNEYDLYIPKEQNKKFPLIIWVHGGGFIGGTKDGGDNVMTALCAGGYAVASINYALAPENRYPAAIFQIGEFTKHILSEKHKYPSIDFTKIVYGGDSAGGQLAAQYVASQTNSTLAQSMGLPIIVDNKVLKACMLVCAPLDIPGLRNYAKKNNKKLCIMAGIWGRAYFGKIRWYSSGAANQTIISSHVTKDFPPTFLTDGNHGSFEIQNRRLAEKLRQTGVRTTELYFDKDTDGQVNHEYLFHLDDSKSLMCLDQMLQFLSETTL